MENLNKWESNSPLMKNLSKSEKTSKLFNKSKKNKLLMGNLNMEEKTNLLMEIPLHYRINLMINKFYQYHKGRLIFKA